MASPIPLSSTVGHVLVIFIGRSDGFGLRIVDRNESDPRLWYYRFQTSAIGWNPGVNVLLPEDYRTSGRTYPVLYLFHGGNDDFRQFDFLGIRNLTAGKPIIVVMPDGGHAGWRFATRSPRSPARGTGRRSTSRSCSRGSRRASACTPNTTVVRSRGSRWVGSARQVRRQVLRSFRLCEFPVSGPASLRRDFGLVVHWANITSAVLDLAGGTVYGAPNWDQARVSADNPVERIESYRNKRVFLVAGTSPDPLNWFDSVNETQVLAGQREFRDRLRSAGIPHEAHELPGGHVFRPEMFRRDLDGIVARLRPASTGRTTRRQFLDIGCHQRS